MNKVIILSGVSGSGKSTLARSIEPAGKFRDGAVYPTIVSADDFFMASGEYRFDPSKLSEAHAACFREYLRHLQLGVEEAIVDNTNTTNEEIAPYYLGAQAYHYQVEIITVFLDGVGTTYHSQVEACAARNKHRVPYGVVAAQAGRLKSRKLPPYWQHRMVSAKF